MTSSHRHSTTGKAVVAGDTDTRLTALEARVLKLEGPVVVPPPVTGYVIRGFGAGATGGKTLMKPQTTTEFVNAVGQGDGDVLVPDGATFSLEAQCYVKPNTTIRSINGASIAGHTLYFEGTYNFRVDNLRFLGGWAGGQDADCITIARGAHNFALSRLSIRAFYDEGVDIWTGCYDGTAQDLLIAPGGDATHNYSLMVKGKDSGDQRISLFRILLYGGAYRTPAIGWLDSQSVMAPGLVADAANLYVVTPFYGPSVHQGGKANIRHSVIDAGQGFDLDTYQLYTEGVFDGTGKPLDKSNVSAAFAHPANPDEAIGFDAIRAAVKANVGCRTLDAFDAAILGKLA